MTPQQLKEIMMPDIESIAERFRFVEARVTALESAKPETMDDWYRRWSESGMTSAYSVPLVWPKLDTPADRQGFEPFEYTERS